VQADARVDPAMLAAETTELSAELEHNSCTVKAYEVEGVSPVATHEAVDAEVRLVQPVGVVPADAEGETHRTAQLEKVQLPEIAEAVQDKVRELAVAEAGACAVGVPARQAAVVHPVNTPE